MKFGSILTAFWEMIREYEIFSLQTGLTYMNQSGGTKMLPDFQPRVEINCKIM